MLCWLDFGHDFTNNPIFSNEKCLAVDAHICLAVVVLLFPHAIQLRNGCIGISQQRKGQTVFVSKFLMRRDTIGTYAQYDNSPFLHLMISIPERARFSSAARGVIFWVKV